MLPVAQSITGRIYSIVLAPLTAHVVVQIDDNFLETFIPRNEAEKLRIGNEVVAFSSDEGTKIRLVQVRMLNSNGKSTRSVRELTTEVSEEQDPKRLMRLVEELMSLLEAEDKEPRTMD